MIGTLTASSKLNSSHFFYKGICTETNPEGTAQTYIFLVDNQDIALNIVMSGYQALCLVQEDDGYYFSADSHHKKLNILHQVLYNLHITDTFHISFCIK